MIRDPHRIESTSFEIIRQELAREIPETLDPIIVRVIHTTADFEYANIMTFQNDPVESCRTALDRGCRIYADTSMICSGVSKKLLADSGSEIYTLVHDRAVTQEAKERGVTRSIVGMEHALRDPKTQVFVIGNAPTALMTLSEKIANGTCTPALVIGVPVGFVGAAESKEELRTLKISVPSISTVGRKGGSTVAVAILNAILKMK